MGNVLQKNMFGKYLIPLVAFFLFLTLWLFIPVSALAENFCYGQNQGGSDGSINNPCLQPKCYRGPNGQGEVIGWVKSESQCRNQSVGKSWGFPGDYKNINRDYWPNR